MAALEGHPGVILASGKRDLQFSEIPLQFTASRWALNGTQGGGMDIYRLYVA